MKIAMSSKGELLYEVRKAYEENKTDLHVVNAQISRLINNELMHLNHSSRNTIVCKNQTKCDYEASVSILYELCSGISATFISQLIHFGLDRDSPIKGYEFYKRHHKRMCIEVLIPNRTVKLRVYIAQSHIELILSAKDDLETGQQELAIVKDLIESYTQFKCTDNQSVYGRVILELNPNITESFVEQKPQDASQVIAGLESHLSSLYNSLKDPISIDSDPKPVIELIHRIVDKIASTKINNCLKVRDDESLKMFLEEETRRNDSLAERTTISDKATELLRFIDK